MYIKLTHQVKLHGMEGASILEKRSRLEILEKLLLLLEYTIIPVTLFGTLIFL